MGEKRLLSLHGEIDKHGHRDFEREHQRNPDFVFHLAGTHAGNLLVVEVKGKLREANWGIIKDFETLLAFTSQYHYEAGLFLLYNHTLAQLVSRLGAALTELATRSSADKVRIWCIKRPGGKLEKAMLSDYRLQPKAGL